jgi:hypothetical protein
MLTGALLAAAGVLTGCGAGAGSAITRISKAADAQVVTAAGRTVPARPGLTLHAGDQVRTAADGAAVLTTGGRKSYLGGQGSYLVSGRGAGVLGRGAFVVDGRKGPALSVTSGSVTARIGRSAVRVEHGFAVRVAVLAGNSVVVNGDPANGPARLSVPTLYQVVVSGRGLTAATPLTLVDDDAERLVAPDLVGDDLQLTRTASALDTGAEGRSLVRIAEADFGSRSVQSRVASETALPIAIARAATPSTTDSVGLRAHYLTATKLRRAGGSWAVVARLVGTNATATGRAIDGLLQGVPSVGTVLAVAPLTNGGPATGSGTSSSQTSAGGNGNSGGGNSSSGNNPSGSKPPSHGPSPSPSPTPGPVQQVVDGVLGILPPVLPGSNPTSKPSARSSASSCKLLGLISC